MSELQPDEIQREGGPPVRSVVRRLDIWMMRFYIVEWRGRWMAANYNKPPWPRLLARMRFHFWNSTMKLQPAWDWMNLKVMALANRLDAKPPNDKLRDGATERRPSSPET